MKKNKKPKQKEDSSFIEQEIEMTKPNESLKVEVRGMKRVLSTKNKTATWY
jgi:hypothetical protein